ncbi:MAG TPA: D-alanyl-D-alanine carboxypeptidase [Desulfobulbaceae bacterium]|nr:D-alanyl-D-alanine carboxypeptidase [Desulfobulbaceae bacterium]
MFFIIILKKAANALTRGNAHFTTYIYVEAFSSIPFNTILMKRFFLHTPPLFLITLFLLSCATTVQAARTPVLDISVKHRPNHWQAAAIPADHSRAAWVKLGDYNDITAIKKRVGSSIGRVSCLPRIRKKISSKSVMIMDAETGVTLFSKAPDRPRQPASTIKVLTGMIAIKSLKNNTSVGVSRHAARMPRSKIYLDTKKQYRADDLINAVLLASANDASVALAEKIAGNEQDFAHMMTLRAKLWGAGKTICRTATGLTAKGQQSTARDLANIFRHAMEDIEFARRMQQVKITTSFGQTLRNHNRALWRVKGAKGGKTGYTAAARQTYVGKFTRKEGAIIVAIMGSETMWSDIKNLVEYGFLRKKQIAGARVKHNKLARAD